MVRLKQAETPRKGEPTIALINIVFLMLIFFLIAGAIAPPLSPEVKSVTSSKSPPAAPPEALSVSKDGRFFWWAEEVQLDDWLRTAKISEDKPLRIMADRELPATNLLAIVEQLKAAGHIKIVLITERDG